MKLLRVFFAVVLLASAQEPLTNDSIVKMTKAGLGEGLIVSMIQNQPGKYSVTPDSLVKLKQAGVSEKVLGAMLSKGSGGAAAPSSGPTAAAEPSTDSDIPQKPPETCITPPVTVRNSRASLFSRRCRSWYSVMATPATRDLIPFESKKAANRMYKVVLPNLGAGEYGILPPGAFGSASSASMGKMYTFRLIE